MDEVRYGFGVDCSKLEWKEECKKTLYSLLSVDDSYILDSFDARQAEKEEDDVNLDEDFAEFVDHYNVYLGDNLAKGLLAVLACHMNYVISEEDYVFTVKDGILYAQEQFVDNGYDKDTIEATLKEYIGPLVKRKFDIKWF